MEEVKKIDLTHNEDYLEIIYKQFAREFLIVSTTWEEFFKSVHNTFELTLSQYDRLLEEWEFKELILCN